MLRHTTTLLLLTAFATVTTTAFGQERRKPAAPAKSARPDPQLIQLLETWSQQSGRVKKLRGTVKRRTYDQAFSTERVAQGVFYYESPDKGRLDFAPVKISQQTIDARNQPGVKVPRDPKGRPYELVSDGNERWICDGKSVISIDDDEKSAAIAELPEGMQGEQIMNTPLPFLFGMPSHQALERFHLELVDVNRNAGTARIKAQPKTRQDGNNWKQADVILDIRTWLPKDVQLTDPAGNKKTVYHFEDMKVNGLQNIWQDPFKPSLRGYKVEVVKADGNQEPVIPNLVGYPYTEAIARLKKLGIDDKNIAKQRGGVAQKQQDELRVRSQDPKPGTPLNQIQQVSIKIWERPKR